MMVKYMFVSRHGRLSADSGISSDGEASSSSSRIDMLLQAAAYLHSDSGEQSSTDQDQFICEYCPGDIFTSFADWHRHDRDMHGDDRSYVCNQCHQRFTRRVLLEQHQSTHMRQRSSSNRDARHTSSVNDGRKAGTFEERRPHSCKHCFNRFKYRKSLNQHIKLRHSKTSPMIIDGATTTTARQQTSQEASSSKRIVNNASRQVFRCNHCGFTHIDQRSLELHKIAFHPPPVVTCAFCYKQFSTTDQLNEHFSCTHGTSDDSNATTITVSSSTTIVNIDDEEEGDSNENVLSVDPFDLTMPRRECGQSRLAFVTGEDILF